MSDEKTNGHNPQTALMIEILQGIKAELSAFREETRGELTDIRGEMVQIRGDLREIHHEIAETNARISLTNTRLEELRADVKGAVETRLLRLEGAVFKANGS
jgi:chromosome segregation ATPase